MDIYIKLNYVRKRQVTSREQEICRNCLNVKDRKEISWTERIINSVEKKQWREEATSLTYQLDQGRKVRGRKRGDRKTDRMI